MLSVRNLSVEFLHETGNISVVKDLSFHINKGQIIALVGESGSGKSVTAQAIMGILPKQARICSGDIDFKPNENPSINLAKLCPQSTAYRQIRGKSITMVFQEPMVAMSPLHSIGFQIEEVLKLHTRYDKPTRHKAVKKLLALVGIADPEKSFNSYPFELSGGLRQRAMIAMAIICHPSLLIADEPTTALDVRIQAQILSLIKQLQRDMQMSVLLITHDLGVVANLASEIVVMRKGKVMEKGPTKELLTHPKHPYLINLLRDVPSLSVNPKTEPFDAFAQNALQIKALSKSFTNKQSFFTSLKKQKRHILLKDFDLCVKNGECLGLVGESGCGKTTLAKLIMGAYQADRGEILFNQNNKMLSLTSLSKEEHCLAYKKIQMVFQDPYNALNPRMTIETILSEPFVIHKMGNKKWRAGRIKELLEMVGLPADSVKRYPHSFSGGQRQRINIARALALEPDLLILDEPVSALDVTIQAQVLDLLTELQSRLNLTYLFISHNLAVVNSIADRIAVMFQGQLMEVATPKTLFSNAKHPYTQSLIAAVPTTDLHHPLQLDKIYQSETTCLTWQPCFSLDCEKQSKLVEIAPEHCVRLSWSTNKSEEHALAQLAS